MITDHCTEMQLLIQADVDGELMPAEAARVAVHLAACSTCAELQVQLLALAGRFRREAPYQPASDALRAAVLRRLAATAPDVLPRDRGALWLPRLRALIRPRLRMTASFGAAFAMAAGLVLAIVLPSRDDLAGTLVAGHYVPNRPVAALVYQRRQHVIDLFVWPENGAGRPNPDATDRNGYNVLRWNRNGMVFWAVSDISPVELAEFVRAWQGA